VLAATRPLVPGLEGLILTDDEADGTYAQSISSVALFSKSAATLEPYKEMVEYRPLDAGKQKAWTDDTSDILGPFLSKLKK
jgi:hypothetical protein